MALPTLTDTAAPNGQNLHMGDGLRTAAFYLPQFHPIPENDEWWGTGFTEWTQRRAGRAAVPRPLPAAPARRARLLRPAACPRCASAQAELARDHGIDAFCYYHYWFDGRRLLERPFDEVLALGRARLPVLLCWANENWTRVWDGGRATC